MKQLISMWMFKSGMEYGVLTQYNIITQIPPYNEKCIVLNEIMKQIKDKKITLRETAA